MKMIADNSFLQDELSMNRFLGKSIRNVLVLSDYSAMEIYRTGNIVSMGRVMKILGEYPHQVEILKGSSIIAGLSGRAAGLQRRLVDQKGTSYFPTFCKEVANAANGNADSLYSFNQLVLAANEQLDILLKHAEHMSGAYAEIAKVFTQDEIKVIRTSETYTPNIVYKLTRFIAEMAVPLVQELPRGRRNLRKEELPNLFVFRLVICNTVLMLNWLSVGGARSTAPEKLRNDMVDCHISAYATYFDGVLTNDKKQAQIFKRTRYILNGFGV